jgi:hypothetical protein
MKPAARLWVKREAAAFGSLLRHGPKGPLVALDVGLRHVGVAISDFGYVTTLVPPGALFVLRYLSFPRLQETLSHGSHGCSLGIFSTCQIVPQFLQTKLIPQGTPRLPVPRLERAGRTATAPIIAPRWYSMHAPWSSCRHEFLDACFPYRILNCI